MKVPVFFIDADDDIGCRAFGTEALKTDAKR